MKVIQKKVCMLGDFAVGKTSLVRRYVEGSFDDKYLSSIGVKISRKPLEREGHKLNLILWDLGGSENFAHLQPSYLQGAAGVLIVLDLTRKETLESLDGYVKQIKEVNKEVEAMGVKILAQYAVLGPYDFVNILEAPDNKTVSKVALELGSRGTLQTMTLAAMPVDELSQ